MATATHPEQPGQPAMSVRQGIIDTLPILPGNLVWAVTFGAAATLAGLPTTTVTLMSAIVFSGTAQLALLKMSTLPLASIFFTCLLLSLRFIPMNVALHHRINPPRWQRV